MRMLYVYFVMDAISLFLLVAVIKASWPITALVMGVNFYLDYCLYKRQKEEAQ